MQNDRSARPRALALALTCSLLLYEALPAAAATVPETIDAPAAAGIAPVTPSPTLVSAPMHARAPQHLTAPAQASPPDAATVDAADELTHLQEQTMLLKAQLKRLDAQAQVDAREAALNHLTVAGNGLNDVRVVAVEGLGQSYSATLRVANSNEFDVHEGDVLPNGGRVESIQADAVYVLTAAGKHVRLTPVSVPEDADAAPVPTPIASNGFNPAASTMPYVPLPKE
jgi:type IV pilus biogenesis protein PilP